MQIQKNALQNEWIIIDELDEYLSPKYSAAILEFLKKKFPWGRWVVTTHSCDLVAFTNNCNLIILDNGNFEVVDINDYTSISGFLYGVRNSPSCQETTPNEYTILQVAKGGIDFSAPP